MEEGEDTFAGAERRGRTIKKCTWEKRNFPVLLLFFRVGFS